MRFLTGPELLEALKPDFDHKMVLETLKTHGIPLKVHWAKEEKLQLDCHVHVKETLHWDPETTLVYYTPRSIYMKPIDKKGHSDHFLKLAQKYSDQTLCLFVENMTAEELIHLIKKTTKMKAFI